MSIKVAIVAHGCRSGGGLFQTSNLLSSLKNVSRGERFLLICSKDSGMERLELPPDSDYYVYRRGHGPVNRLWFERVTLPKLIDDYDPDVIYCPSTKALLKPKRPQALFIRNPYLFYPPKHYPDFYLGARLRIAEIRRHLKTSLRRTPLVFCQTPVVKERFSEAFRYPKDQIRVMPFPPPAEIMRQEDSVPSVYDRADGAFYFLLLTVYQPHKDPSILIPLCRKFGREFRERKIRFVTTFDPGDHPRAPKLLKNIARYGLDDLIVNQGHIPRGEVAAHLSSCDVMWLPTLAECLATTYLEAMAVGVPIMAPDLDFARYVCEEGAFYYDPWDLDSVFKALMTLREGSGVRKELVDKARLVLKREGKFPASWDDVASATLDCLRELLKADSI